MKLHQTRREFLQLGTMLVARPAFFPQSSSARITTIAGTGKAGAAPDGAMADTAEINNPYGVVIGPDGGLYWCDLGSSRILRLDFGTKKISVVAGNGTMGYAGNGGPAALAQLNTPHEIRFDSKGDLYMVERDNHAVRRVNMKSRTISTVAGTAVRGYSGDGGPADKAQLAQPHSIAFDRNDNLFICDILNNRVRRVDARTGIITTFAGNGEKGPAPNEGALTTTPLSAPRSLDITLDGKMFLVLREGNTVLAIDAAQGRLKRLAGTGEVGYSSDGGPAISAKLNGPKGIAYAGDMLYIVDTENHVIRRVDLRNGTISTVAGNGQKGDGPDGDPANCRLNRPHGVFVRGRTLYIGDSENHRIRAVQLM